MGNNRFRVTALLAAAVAIVGFGAPSAAIAADVSDSVVRDITITTTEGSTGPLVRFTSVDVSVAISSQPNRVAAGDTFAVTFPPELLLQEASFPLTSGSTVLATCDAVNATRTITCTFTEAAAALQYVTGSLSVRSQAVQTTTRDAVDFTVSGEVRTVDLPGEGGIVPNEIDVPDDVRKDGYVDASRAGVITWRITMRASVFPADQPITITDTIGGGAALITDSFRILSYADVAAYQARTGHHSGVIPQGAGQIELAPGTSSTPPVLANTSLTITSPSAFNLSFANVEPGHDGVYELFYDTTIPAGTTPGTAFTNDAEVSGKKVATTVTYSTRYDGNLDGPGYGGLSVAKTVSGEGSAIAADDTFTVRATWMQDGAGRSQDLTVSAQQSPTELHQIPTGTEVTLTELTDAHVPGVLRFDPTFQPGAGIVVAADGRSAVVTIGDQTTVAVTVDNAIVPHAPAIDIEKYAGEWDGVRFVDGAPDLTNGQPTTLPTGDADTVASSIDLTPSGATSITMTVTNTGTEALTSLVVRDVVTQGGTISQLACTFPGSTTPVDAAEDGSVTAPSDAVLAAGAAFDCTARLSGVTASTAHVDTASVMGVGVGSRIEVRDADDFHAHATTVATTPPPATPTPGVSHPPASLPRTGAEAALGAALFAALLIGGGLALRRRTH